MRDHDSAKPTALLLVILSIIGRLIPHPANFTPLGGSVTFGGAKLSRPWNFLAPLFVLFVTDIFLGFHGTMIYVYVSFIVIALLADKLLRNKSNLLRVGSVSLLGSFIFFIVTNYGVWAEGLLYPHTLQGLIACYVAAVPFFGNTLTGDLIFSVGFFGVYQWAEQRQLINIIDNKLVTLAKN